MLPVLWKELRSRMRGAGAPVTVTIYLGLLAAVALGVLAFLQRQGRGLMGMGETALALYAVLSGLQLLLVALITPALTAGAIAGERERQTLDLLLTTGLSGWGILAGKLAAALAFVLLLLTASVPVFMVIFAFGGVHYAALLRMLVLQFATALGMGCAGLLLSVLVRRSGIATALSVGLAVMLLFGSLGLGVLQGFRQAAQVQHAVAVQATAAVPMTGQQVAVAVRSGSGPVVVRPAPPPVPQAPVMPPRERTLPGAFYLSPLTALAALVVPADAGVPFGRVPIGPVHIPAWQFTVVLYLAGGIVIFLLAVVALERRAPQLALLRRSRPVPNERQLS